MNIKKRTRPSSICHKGRRIKKGAILFGKIVPVNLSDGSNSRPELKVVYFSKKRGLIKLEYQNRFMEDDPLIKRHRTIVLTLKEFEKTGWFEQCPEI